ncbi:sensor histidine kinase [Planobispora siamensis]|uniref:Oxygen sensor histidine kinase NreB n=1 Tax=Planobispora siamensis TaxID=936338 RepID=A0A8J3SPF2_9ACTN|nr:sensor histidine kinase [Planobispora siamensis]GIH97035.1 histidine kinase [Planobispora siamensis]
MADPFPLSRWERRFDRAVEMVPYFCLGISTIISLTTPDRPGGTSLVTLGLVAVALAWLVSRTLLPGRWRNRPGVNAGYFAGVLATAALLALHDPVFTVYTVSGFFLAFLFAPSKWTFAAVAATSLVLYGTVLDWSQATVQLVLFHAAIVIVQTFSIGGGHIMAVKIDERQRRYRKALDDLEAAMKANADLHAQLTTQAHEAGVLDERQRMAREIHDTLAQGLTGIITQLQAAKRAGDVSDHVDLALSLARDSLSEARRSVQALRPRELETAHLPEALSAMARRWAEGSGVDLRFEVTGESVPLSPAIEVTLFRVAQEALTNVAKHARASRAGLTLSYAGDVVLLDIRDDGGGIGSGNGRGFGLNSMRQRVRGVGGILEIESVPGEGTAVSASVPALQAARK